MWEKYEEKVYTKNMSITWKGLSKLIEKDKRKTYV